MRWLAALPFFLQVFIAFVGVWALAAGVAAIAYPDALQPLALFGLMLGLPWAIWCALGLLVQWVLRAVRKPA